MGEVERLLILQMYSIIKRKQQMKIVKKILINKSMILLMISFILNSQQASTMHNPYELRERNGELIKKAEAILAQENGHGKDNHERSAEVLLELEAEALLELEKAQKISYGCMTGWVGVFNEAATLNCSRVVQLLIKQRNMNPNDSGNVYTPLLRAADGGCYDVLKILLEDPRTNRYAQDSFGRTAFKVVAEKLDYLRYVSRENMDVYSMKLYGYACCLELLKKEEN